MKTKEKGDIAELAVYKEYKKLGYIVSQPFGDIASYDLIVDMKNDLKKVQVKNGRYKDGCIIARLRKTHRNKGEHVNKFYGEEIDEFAIYSPKTDNVYTISYEEAPKSSVTFRLEGTNSIENKNIRWAKDYKI